MGIKQSSVLHLAAKHPLPIIPRQLACCVCSTSLLRPEYAQGVCWELSIQPTSDNYSKADKYTSNGKLVTVRLTMDKKGALDRIRHTEGHRCG